MVNGKEIPASPSVIKQKEEEYDNKIKAIENQIFLLKQKCGQNTITPNIIPDSIPKQNNFDNPADNTYNPDSPVDNSYNPDTTGNNKFSDGQPQPLDSNATSKLPENLLGNQSTTPGNDTTQVNPNPNSTLPENLSGNQNTTPTNDSTQVNPNLNSTLPDGLSGNPNGIQEIKEQLLI